MVFTVHCPANLRGRPVDGFGPGLVAEELAQRFRRDDARAERRFVQGVRYRRCLSPLNASLEIPYPDNAPALFSTEVAYRLR